MASYLFLFSLCLLLSIFCFLSFFLSSTSVETEILFEPVRKAPIPARTEYLQRTTNIEPTSLVEIFSVHSKDSFLEDHSQGYNNWFYGFRSPDVVDLFNFFDYSSSAWSFQSSDMIVLEAPRLTSEGGVITSIPPPLSHGWFTSGTLPSSLLTSHSIFIQCQDKVFLFGSPTSSYSYDPDSGLWNSNLPPIPVPVFEAAGSTDGNLIYIFGGAITPQLGIAPTSPTRASNLVQIFDPISQVWLGSSYFTPVPVAKHRVSFLNGRFYIVGGTQSSNIDCCPQSSVYSMNPLDGSWRKERRLWQPRSVHGQVTYNGKIYVFGGHGLSSTEVFDPQACNNDGRPCRPSQLPAKGAWLKLSSMRISRGWLASTVSDSLIYAISGFTGSVGKKNIQLTPTVEVFNLTSGQWSFIDSLSLPVARAEATALSLREHILLFGGSNDPSHSIYPEILIASDFSPVRTPIRQFTVDDGDFVNITGFLSPSIISPMDTSGLLKGYIFLNSIKLVELTIALPFDAVVQSFSTFHPVSRGDILLFETELVSLDSSQVTFNFNVDLTFFQKAYSGSDLVGSLGGEPVVDDAGGLSIQLPIVVPPGAGGLSPDLALSYSSASGDSLLGLGWSFSGFSRIHRCGKTFLQDGYISGITNTQEDNFCIDGVRLIPISVSDQLVEYRTELESFSKIVSFGNGNLEGPSMFKIWSRDHKVLTYGDSVLSRVISSSSQAITEWVCSTIQDSFGNSIIFNYTAQDYSNNIHPLTVSYTKNPNVDTSAFTQITFIYESRPDVSESWLVGDKTSNDVRLASVQVFRFGQLTTTYELNYLPFDKSSFWSSRLSSIRQCQILQPTLHCLPPLKLKWAMTTNPLEITSIGRSNLRTLKHASHYWVGDFDGDGKQELFTKGSSNSAQIVWSSEGHLLNKAKNYFDLGKFRVPKYHTGDFNGDGKTDILFLSEKKIVIYTFSISSQTFTSNSISYSSFLPQACDSNWRNTDGSNDNTYHNLVGDFNGDGRADVAHFYKKGQKGYFDMCFSSSSQFRCQCRLDTGYSGAGTFSNTASADFDGDGLDDWIYLKGDDTIIVVYSRFQSADVYEPFIPPNPIYLSAGFNKNRVKVADFNGDGIADLGYVSKKAFVTIWISKGRSASFESYSSQLTKNADYQRTYQFFDLNLDGKLDIFQVTSKHSFDVWLSNGTSFNYLASYSDTIFQQSWGLSEDENSAQYIVADFYGRGSTSILHIDQDHNSRNRVFSWQVSPADRVITGIDNGLISTLIDYLPASSKLVHQYDSGANPSYPTSTFHSSSYYLVSSLQTDNGIGGKSSSRFLYQDGQWHAQGLGFIGFQSRKIISDQRSVHKFFTRDWNNRIFDISSQQTFDIDNHLIEQSIFHYSADNLKIMGLTSFFYYNDFQLVFNYDPESGLPLSLFNQTTFSNRTSFGFPTKVISALEDEFGVYGSEVNTEYFSDSSISESWLIGLIASQNSRFFTTAFFPDRFSPSTDEITTLSRFEYDLHTGALILQVDEPDSPLFTLFTQLQYDTFGNIINQTVFGPTVSLRSSNYQYEPNGRRPIRSSNPLGHQTLFSYVEPFDEATKITDSNGLVTSFIYDPLGRVQKRINPDGSFEITQLNWCTFIPQGEPSCQINAAFAKKLFRSDGSTEWTHFDHLGRIIGSISLSLENMLIAVQTRYDHLFRPYSISQPKFMSSSEPTLWTTTFFDRLDRPIMIAYPDGSTVNTSYIGATQAITDQLGRTSFKTINGIGNLINFTDSNGTQMLYVYNALGDVSKIMHQGHLTEKSYDRLRRLIKISDESRGSITFSYDALGNLNSQTFNSGRRIAKAYDQLDRVVEVIAGSERVTYEYDTAPHGIGMLSNVTNNGRQRSYLYDNRSRIVSITDRIPSVDFQEFQTTFEYNVQGKLFRQTDHQMGICLQHSYSPQGILNEKSLCNNPSTPLWELRSVAPSGKPLQINLIGDVQKEYHYDQLNRVTNISGSTPSRTFQGTGIEYDIVGNVKRLSNDIKIKRHSLHNSYDYADRLLSSTWSDDTLSLSQHLQIEYDNQGNIVYKSNIGRYSYSNSNQLLTVDGELSYNFEYDLDGNVIFDSYRHIQYNEFYQPLHMTGFGAEASFTYDFDGQSLLIRQDRTDSSSLETIFIRNVQRLFNGTQYIYRYSVDQDLTLERIFSVSHILIADSKKIYFHDHLGTILSSFDIVSNSVQEFSYDVYGSERDPSFSQFTQPPACTSLCNPNPLEIEQPVSGYADHVMLRDFGLIHMNSRLYDPLVGRFWSPDPQLIVDFGIDAINPYIYALNNPTSLNDPDGKSSIGRLLKGISKATGLSQLNKFIQKNPTVQRIGLVLVAAVATSTGNPVLVPAYSAYICKLNGGSEKDMIKSAALAAAEQIAFNAVHIYVPNGVSKIVAHGAVSGTFAAASGGNFWRSAAAGALTKALAPVVEVSGNPLIRIGAAGAVGGAVSSIAGGKFRDGFFHGVMARAFNDEFQKLSLRDLVQSNRALTQYISDIPTQSLLDEFNYADSALYYYDERNFQQGMNIVDIWVPDLDFFVGKGLETVVKKTILPNLSQPGYRRVRFFVDKGSTYLGYFGTLKNLGKTYEQTTQSMLDAPYRAQYQKRADLIQRELNSRGIEFKRTRFLF